MNDQTEAARTITDAERETATQEALRDPLTMAAVRIVVEALLRQREEAKREQR